VPRVDRPWAAHPIDGPAVTLNLHGRKKDETAVLQLPGLNSTARATLHAYHSGGE